MGSWLQDPLPENFGRYRIIKVLGQGGMGSVYLARDTQLEREVALKVPHFDPVRGPRLLDRFEQEARAAARVHHPNICPIYDVGEIDGKRYLTMAFIDGIGLNRLLRRGRRVTPRQAAHLIRRVALAAQEAHQSGVIHRDLKPSNIMIDRRGEPIIMDFGLARRFQSEDVHLTRIGSTMGTPAYMAPEQCRGDRQALGPPCDIYSLGVILYELLAGRQPFSGEDSLAILSKVLVDEPTRPSAHRPDTDAELERICLKAMAKKAEERYPSAGALAADLKTYLKNQATTASAASMMVPILLDDSESDTEVEAPDGRFTKLGGPPPLPPDDQGIRVGRADRADRQPAPAATRNSATRDSATREDPAPRPHPVRPRRLPILGLLVAAVGLAALLVILPVVGYVIYRATDRGTCRIELSDPNAAVTVRVDGADVDINAADGLRLAAGAHDLDVRGKEYDPVHMQFTIHRGENPPVVVPLVLRPATVTIVLSEPGAAVEIKIDGQPGFRHGQVLRLTPRQTHVVEVSGRGYRDERRAFVLEPGLNMNLNVALTKVQGVGVPPPGK